MCFSAEASFTSAALLGVIFYATLRKVTSKKQYFLVSLIGFEVVMQMVEGFVWLAFKNGFYPSFFIPLGAYYFLIVAHFVWPVGFPYSFYVLEQNQQRRKCLGSLCMVTLLVPLYVIIMKLINPTPPTAYIVNKNIYYSFSLAENFLDTSSLLIKYLYGFIFVLIFLLTAVFSSMKGKWILFFFTFISFAITLAYYSHAATSVWCFFATVVAACIYVIVEKNPMKVK